MDKYLIKKVTDDNKSFDFSNNKFKTSISSQEVNKNMQMKTLEKGKECQKKNQVLKNEVPSDSNDFFETSSCSVKEVAYNLAVCPHSWRQITAEKLNLDYTRIFNRKVADDILKKLEEEVEYFSGDLTKVKVYNKWYQIPRKQVSYGDPGLSYTFSNTSVPAVPWNKCGIIMELKKVVESVTGHSFNFVLVNRYKDGTDHMGEHRDDEKDLVATAPIASLSFGQPRDFIFKHKDARGKNHKRQIDPVKMELEHGSLLLMKYPTNNFWYHSLPVRKKADRVRINLTFRQMIEKKV